MIFLTSLNASRFTKYDKLMKVNNPKKICTVNILNSEFRLDPIGSSKTNPAIINKIITVP